MTSQPDPDPRTAPEDLEDATDQGVSSQSPAEGDDDVPPAGPGSPDDGDSGGE